MTDATQDRAAQMVYVPWRGMEMGVRIDPPAGGPGSVRNFVAPGIAAYWPLRHDPDMRAVLRGFILGVREAERA